MYETTSKIYLEFADRLFERIGTSEFFAGVITLYDGDVECRLACTVVVRRASMLEIMLGARPIERVLPVWWEMRTLCDGREIDNDFSFSEMLSGQCGKE